MSQSNIVRTIGYKEGWYKSPLGGYGISGPLKFHINSANKNIVLSILPQTVIKLNLEEMKSYISNSNIEIDEILNIGNGLKLTFKTNFIIHDTIERIEKTVSLVKKYPLKKYEHEKYKCEECHEESKIEAYSIQKTFLVFYCENCYNETKIELEKAKQKYKNIKGNYFKGAIGAIIFSIPGLIVWYLLEKHLGLFSTISPILVSILNIKGYEYFLGKYDSYTKYIFIITNLASLLVGCSVIFAFLALEQIDTLQLIIKSIIETEEVRSAYLEYMYKNTLIGMFIGLFFFFSIGQPYIGIRPAKRYKWLDQWG